MFYNHLYLSLIFLSIKEFLSYPLEYELFNSTDLGYQLFNLSDLLVYQQYELAADKSSKRNKRWLEELFSYFYDSSEEVDNDEDSSELKLSDNNSNNKSKTAYGLCHDCTVTYNQVHQEQHINRFISSDSSNASSTTPINTYEIKSTLTTPKPRKTNSPQGKTIESDEKTTFIPTTRPITIQPMTSVIAEITSVSDTQIPIEKMSTIEAATRVEMTSKVNETPNQEATTLATTVAPTIIVTLATTTPAVTTSASITTLAGITTLAEPSL